MKPRKYTPSKRVRNHIAKWEASDFAGQNAAFGGDAVGAKAIELMDMLGDKANAFTDNELDGLLSTYYNLSPRGFRKTLMPYIDAYAADLSDVNKKGLDLAMRDRWRIAAKKYQRGIRRRANADADLMGLSYQDPIVEQPDVIKRTNIVVPEENTEPTWKGAENISPYVTGKPIIKLQPRLKLPPIEELMEDSAWEPSFRLNPRGYKNGKFPRYEGGLIPGLGPEKKLSPKDVKVTGGEPGLETVGPIEKALLYWLGGRAVTGAMSMYNAQRRFNQLRELYKRARQWNEQTTGASRKWKIADADKTARDSRLHGSDNPAGWLYDVLVAPAINAYDKLNQTPIGLILP